MKILRSALVYMGINGALGGMILGGLSGTLFGSIYGTVLFGMIGAGTGIILGIFDATIMAIIWDLFGESPHNSKHFQIIISVVVMGFTLLATPFALAGLLSISITYLDCFFVCPATIAAVVSGDVCHSFLKTQSPHHKKKKTG